MPEEEIQNMGSSNTGDIAKALSRASKPVNILVIIGRDTEKFGDCNKGVSLTLEFLNN